MAPAEVKDDYYGILEVSQTADILTIKKSYHRLALRVHPDKDRDSPNATILFQRVSLPFGLNEACC